MEDAQSYGADKYTYDAAGRVTNPGKFQGERRQLIEAYQYDMEGFSDSFGNTEGGGYYFGARLDSGEDVYGRIDSQGFVHEITEATYKAAEDEHGGYAGDRDS